MKTTLSTSKVRISKKTLAAFPPEVSERIAAIAESYRVSSMRFNRECEGFAWYAGEGEFIEVVFGKNHKAVEMVSENTIGASGLNLSIGARVELPVGAFLIVVSYYAGYMMSVYNVVPAEIAA